MKKRVLSLVLVAAFMACSLLSVSAIDTETINATAKIEAKGADQGVYAAETAITTNSGSGSFDFMATLDMSAIRNNFVNYLYLAKKNWGEDVVNKSVSGSFDLVIGYPKENIVVPETFLADSKELVGFTGIDTGVFEETSRALDASGETNKLTIKIAFKPVVASEVIKDAEKYLKDIVLESQ